MRSATGGSTPPKFAPGGLAAPTPLLTSPTSLPSVRTPYDPFVAYGRSKAANILFAMAFDKRHRSRGVRAAVVHPGGVQTELTRHRGADALQKVVDQTRRFLDHG